MSGTGRTSFEPGMWVRNPACPEWGIGQVQSAVGERVTVNFTETGKLLVNVAVVPLEMLDGPGLEPAAGDET